MQKVMSSHRNSKIDKYGWWQDFFPAFRSSFDILPEKDTRAEVRYFCLKLGLKKGTKFLDCPCGIGRISIPLAQRGIRVTGVDITQSYLDELSQIAAAKGLRIRTIHNDMRRIKFEAEFDAAGNLWTSLGYFEKETDNFLVLKKIFKALKPGGKFMLNIINRDWIMKNYTPTSWYNVENGLVFEERKFDYSRSINVCSYHFYADNRIITRKANIRLYSYHELLAMMTRAGFVDITGFGSLKDEPIDRDRMMMYIIGNKPK